MEGALVGQVGQPIAGRSPQNRAMVAHQSPTAEEIEHSATADQRDQRDQRKDRPQFIQLRVVGAMVVGHLVGVAATWKVDRDDELEVAAVLAATALASRV